MKWPRRKRRVPNGGEELLRESRAEKAKSEAQFRRASELAQEAKKLGDEAEEIRQQNHFGELALTSFQHRKRWWRPI